MLYTADCSKFVRLFFVLSLFLVFVKGSDDSEVISANLTAVEDRSVVLPCNVSFPAENDAISLVLWFRGDSGVPIYSLDARNGSIYKAFHFSDDILGTRAYFNLTSKPPLLKIEPVKEEDEGEYECRVDYRRARTEKWRGHLRVIVPPKNVVIMDHEGTQIEGIIGRFNEGSFLSLSCEAEGDPTPAVTWWRDSALLDDDYNLTPRGIVRNELLIKRLQRDHLMSVLTCQASNSDFNVPVSRSVTLDLNLKPLDVRISTLKRPLSAGRQVEVVCQSSGSRPPARILWWKGTERISKTTVPRNDNVTVSKITFLPTIEDHGKHLSCQADNPMIPNSALEDGWTLTIFYLPKLRLSLGANIQHDTIKEGSDVYFDCNIQANPWVSEVGWRFEGKPFFSKTKEGIIISNQTLVLQKVTRERRGRYQCVAANVEGEVESEEIILRVHYAPVCKPGQKIVYGVARIESVIIRCEVLADPEDVTFHWSLNNTFERIELHSFTTNGTISEATYKPRTRYGYGILSCWGKNEIGAQKEPCNYTIIPAGRPDPVKNCEITNRTITVIEIECEAGYNGGLKQMFHLEVFNSPLDRLQINMSEKDFPTFTINNLPPGTNFLLAIYASNSKGKSHSVALTATTLPAPEKRTAKIERPIISPVLGILIGIVGALVLMAVFIVIIMRLRAQEEEKGPVEQDIVDKSQTPLQKDMDDPLDPDSREPDVIPASAIDLHERNGGIGRVTGVYHTAHNGKDRPRNPPGLQPTVLGTTSVAVPTDKQEVTYAELSMPTSHASTAVRRTEPPTEYAQIDFFRQAKQLVLQPDHEEDDSHITAETPLMEALSSIAGRHRITSVSDRSKISTPV
ncbi:nephrin-like isoform X1 [Limulus polyphemus]|uniref:Nephrin-like isoform X1 n=1 Tax=Limulus polyphemus TaxID=6850 RepID=A0ABM1T170_LIMPO|nr:nephrin-like isoform X1 [Limulus polyphemus]